MPFAKLNVRIVGTNIGFSSDWLGFTHQALEDVALMRSLPNMTVLVPADGEETYRLVEALINIMKDRLIADPRHRTGAPCGE